MLNRFVLTFFHGNATSERAFCADCDAPMILSFLEQDSRTVLRHSEQREYRALRKIGVFEDPPASQTTSPSLRMTGSRCGAIRARLAASIVPINRLPRALSLG
jgi:hypothetical protein